MTAHYTTEMEKVLKDKISNAKYPTRILHDGQGILVEGDEYKFVGKGKEVKFNVDTKQELNIIWKTDQK